jgi:hypothetical protein
LPPLVATHIIRTFEICDLGGFQGPTLGFGVDGKFLRLRTAIRAVSVLIDPLRVKLSFRAVRGISEIKIDKNSRDSSHGSE